MLDIVLLYSERSTTGCWRGVLFWILSDVDIDNVFDVVEISFVPLFDLITSRVVVERSVFDMRLGKGASAYEDGDDC